MSAANTTTPYRLNESQYGSHSVLLSHFPAPGNGRRILDVGCGDGYVGAILASRGYSVVGVERRGGYTDRFPASVTLVEADLENGMPSDIGSDFDYTICADVLEHVRRPEILLRDIAVVLKNGGKLIASLPNSGNIYFRANVLLGRFPQDERGLFDRTHVRFYMWDGWRQLLENSGFRIESVESTGIPFHYAFPSLERSAVLSLAEAAYSAAVKIWRRLFAYQFVVVAVPTR